MTLKPELATQQIKSKSEAEHVFSIIKRDLFCSLDLCQNPEISQQGIEERCGCLSELIINCDTEHMRSFFCVHSLKNKLVEMADFALV